MSEIAYEQFPTNFWYAALSASDLKRGQMKRQMLCNRPFLILRDENGGVSALDDHCPHRGIPLSDGRFDGKEVECCYHGWKFNCDGVCTEIPSLMPDSPVKTERIRTKNFPCKECDELICLYLFELSLSLFLFFISYPCLSVFICG